jgi:hypothetical protein
VVVEEVDEVSSEEEPDSMRAELPTVKEEKPKVSEP